MGDVGWENRATICAAAHSKLSSKLLIYGKTRVPPLGVNRVDCTTSHAYPSSSQPWCPLCRQERK